ncbi:winged helix-turn-helix transcriptional regulator [Vreelandella arcis]|uniref:winged helix-turn-helix transcriptional regulator n=1 Tax=Vreelandella arcis TaxID=416873 RepID=UPI000B7CF312|nr:helix-turn-helix domain-containing protein [Halomonas arcis]
MSSRTPSSYRKLEEVVGCKWSVSVLLSVDEGVNRPGALERHIDGISTKVLSERLRKLTSYGLLKKKSFPEVPPRTEYSLTPSGKKLIMIIKQIHTLDTELGYQETK